MNYTLYSDLHDVLWTQIEIERERELRKTRSCNIGCSFCCYWSCHQSCTGELFRDQHSKRLFVLSSRRPQEVQHTHTHKRWVEYAHNNSGIEHLTSCSECGTHEQFQTVSANDGWTNWLESMETVRDDSNWQLRLAIDSRETARKTNVAVTNDEESDFSIIRVCVCLSQQPTIYFCIIIVIVSRLWA